MFGIGRRRKALEGKVAGLQAVVGELQAEVGRLAQAADNFDAAADEVAKQVDHCDDQLQRLEVKRRRLAALESKARKRGDLPPDHDDDDAMPAGGDRLTSLRTRARERGYYQ